MATVLPQTKKDKYEQILSKYDWNSPHPPRSYQYGVGRGAKGFSTSAELSSATALAAATMTLTAGEIEFLDALNDIEERRQHKRNRPDGEKNKSHVSKKAKTTILSMEDIATVGSGVNASSLIKRQARTEDMDVVDSYAFADETAVVTASDLLRSHAVVANQTLENILGMGSPTEQTTWITHSRALREMGMSRKAQQTLLEGCRLTGSKGPLIWTERLEHTQDPAARRLLLEEAVRSCRGCEELWLRLLEHEPPHERQLWLQQAVMACPASECLWIRVLEYVPAPRDQRKIIRKALELTPRLPSLWAMLARLESYETGKAIFNAAMSEHPSLHIVVEAAKFAEFHHRVAGHLTTGNMLAIDTIDSFIRQAAEKFLSVEVEASRREWLAAARIAARERYVVTAAYLYIYFAAPPPATRVAASWLDDLIALLGEDITSSAHDVYCALWAALLILRDCAVADRGLDVMASAVSSATPADMDSAIASLQRSFPRLSQDGHSSKAAEKAMEGTAAHTTTNTKKKGEAEEEEEEEELERPAATDAAHATSATAASRVLPLPISLLLRHTLTHIPTHPNEDCALRLARALFARDRPDGAALLLQAALSRETVSATLYVSAAKALLATGRTAEAEALLVRGTAVPSATTDIAFVKLAVHRRSRGEDIGPLLQAALDAFPRSPRLWLMRLEAAAAAAAKEIGEKTHTSAVAADMRGLYTRALSPAHCRDAPAVWCYAATRLESDVLSSAGAARALLLDGIVACVQRQPNADARAAALVLFGIARCAVELAHAGRASALEAARETLQQLPKRDGGFTVPVGELVALYIDLEAPAARGRAAAQAVQQWRVREPLVLAAIARVYYAAGRAEKAIEQAMKAVRASDGRCGDAIALWLKLSAHPAAREEEEEGAADKGETKGEAVGAEEGQRPLGERLAGLWEQLGGAERRPNSGPLWIRVAKAQDPTNVTLLGYRDSVESMIQRVMDLIEL